AGWLFVVARNVNASAVRRGVRRATQPTDPVELVDGPSRDETAMVDAAEWIRQTLSVLPPRERAVVGAIDVAGLDVAAASRLLNISRSAVRSAHYRGLRRLAAAEAGDDARLGRHR